MAGRSAAMTGVVGLTARENATAVPSVSVLDGTVKAWVSGAAATAAQMGVRPCTIVACTYLAQTGPFLDHRPAEERDFLCLDRDVVFI